MELSIDREKVIKGLECHAEVNCTECPYRVDWHTCPFGETLLVDAVTLIKEQEKTWKFYVDKCDELYFIAKNRVEIVRCKDCIHRGKSEKCVLAAISEEKDCSLFMLDNRGEWFCADGKRRDGDVE